MAIRGRVLAWGFVFSRMANQLATADGFRVFLNNIAYEERIHILEVDARFRCSFPLLGPEDCFFRKVFRVNPLEAFGVYQ